MKRFLLFLGLFFAPMAAFGQQTKITATIVDPAGHTYQFLTGRASISCPGNATATYNGYSIPQTITITGGDGTGTFSLVLWDVNAVQPSGCSWTFAITAQNGTTNFIAPNIGGASSATPITGLGPVNLSAPINAYAVLLPSSGGGGTGPALQTNGVTNTTQSLLNLKNGTNVTITSDAGGGVTVNAATAAAPSFSSITAGTNTSAAMVVGTGGSLSPASNGTILATSTKNAATPSTVYTFYPATSSSCLVYSATGTTYCALNTLTGNIDYEGTDAAAVINSALAATALTGGTYFFKDGIYNFNSATQETYPTLNSFWYCVGIPSQPSAYTQAAIYQFIFEGESRPGWLGEGASINAIQNSGVIFNVTPTAVAAAGSAVLSAFWQRPNTTLSNEDFFSNLDVRFPTNQRGNTIGINAWYAGSISYNNVMADFNLIYSNIQQGSAPVVGSFGSIGLTSTISSSGNTQIFTNTYVTGYDRCYDFASEHVVGNTVTAIYCNHAAAFGAYNNNMTGSIYHPSVITKFIDQENAGGIQFGSHMQQGTRVDLIGLDIEISPTGWYARTSGEMSEVNPGYTSGTIEYSIVEVNIGNIAGAPLFSSGGQSFTQFNSYTPLANPNPSVYSSATTAIDTFSRPNAVTLGGNWGQNTVNQNVEFQIISNTAQPNGSIAAQAFQPYTGLPNIAGDQFSTLTVGALSATAGNVIETQVRMDPTPANESWYAYFVAGNAAGSSANGIPGGSGIIKVVSGTATTLAVQTSTAGATTGDVLELRAIGSTIAAYKNGVLDTSFSPNPVVDTSLSSGVPGMNMRQTGAGTSSASNWTGGNLVTGSNSNESIFNFPNTWVPLQTFTGGIVSAAGAFTTLSASGNMTTNVTGGGTQCLHVSNTGVVSGLGSDCGSSGATTAFSGLTSGTNTAMAAVCGTGCSIATSGSGTNTATAMPFSGLSAGTGTAGYVIGTGGSIGVSGSGTNYATSLLGNTWASPGAQGTGTPNTAIFSALTDTALSTTTSPICPNGAGGAFTTSGCVSGGSIFPVTVSGTTTSGGIPYFSATTTETSSGILNTNILVKGGGAGGAPTNSSITDNGTTISSTEPVSFGNASFGGGASAAGSTASGGWACTESANTGWTPTSGQDYMRCDSTLHAFICSINGAAESGCTFGVPVTINNNSLATTPSDAYEAFNNTASTSGAAAQDCPSYAWKGHVWNTTSVAADNTARWIVYCTVTSGTTPFTTLTFASSVDTGSPSYGTKVGFDSFGGITAGSFNVNKVAINGTTFAASGCSNGTLVGGATAGSYNSGTSGTCTVTITMGSSQTATHTWACWANDITTKADTQNCAGTSATQVVITGTTVSGDTIQWGAVAY